MLLSRVPNRLQAVATVLASAGHRTSEPGAAGSMAKEASDATTEAFLAAVDAGAEHLLWGMTPRTVKKINPARLDAAAAGSARLGRRALSAGAGGAGGSARRQASSRPKVASNPILKVKGDSAPFGLSPGRFDVYLEQPTPLWGASAFAGYRVSIGDFADYDGKLVTNNYGRKSERASGAASAIMVPSIVGRRRCVVRKRRYKVADASLGEARLQALPDGSSRYIDWVGAGLRRRQIATALLDLANDAMKRFSDSITAQGHAADRACR